MTRWKLITIQRRAKGLCPSGGKRMPESGRKTCAPCIRAAGARRTRWRNDGLCVDCRTPTGGTRRCTPCRLRNAEAYR